MGTLITLLLLVVILTPPIKGIYGLQKLDMALELMSEYCDWRRDNNQDVDTSIFRRDSMTHTEYSLNLLYWGLPIKENMRSFYINKEYLNKVNTDKI